MIMTDNLDDAATKAVAVACIVEEANEVKFNFKSPTDHIVHRSL